MKNTKNIRLRPIHHEEVRKHSKNAEEKWINQQTTKAV